METQILTENMIQKYYSYLQNEEKSKATIEKYMRDVKKFYFSLDNIEVTKDTYPLKYLISRIRNMVFAPMMKNPLI